MADIKEPLIPKIGVVTDIRIDTPDVKTFRVVTPDGKKAFEGKGDIGRTGKILSADPGICMADSDIYNAL